MDQPGLAPAVHRQALRALGRVNRLSSIGRTLWSRLRPLLEEDRTRTWRMLDVACGGGDVAVGLSLKARQAGLRLVVDGCDVSPVALDFATAQAEAHGLGGSRFFPLDVLHHPLPGGYDVVMCSLFLHHLEPPDARLLLQKMHEAAGRMVLVDDLRRTRLGYFMAWLGARVLTRCPVVHVDGPLSVQGAFTIDEARELAEGAGLTGATFRRHWPQRFLLEWRRPQAVPLQSADRYEALQ